jgi:hypothetical protein
MTSSKPDSPTPQEKVMALIDEEGEPGRMTAKEWAGFLGSIISECRSRLAAAKEDVRRDR